MTAIYLLFALLVGENALSSEPPKVESKRIKITSKKAIHNTETQKSILKENVRVIDGELVIDCELMTIESNDKKEVNFVLAEKEVVIIKKDSIATGDRAEYYVLDKRVELTGNAQIVQTDPKTGEKQIIKGSKIIFYRDKNIMEVEDFDGDAPAKK
ncbi:MAG: hypothetical protein NE328_09080 [Lentisphaeraceae bacterium]|nr:hypothetical protein [Lentisphaeraceae bacterium]